MKITDLEGLYVATSADNFKILVASDDSFDAKTKAENYFGDAGIDSENVKVEAFTDVNTHFDCDYVVY
jgi:hypothetical protein